jgi:hypothetical protein
VRISASTSSTALIAVFCLGAYATGAQQKDTAPVNRDAQVLSDFKTRVDQYVEIRKKADDSAPPLAKTDDPAKIRQAQQALAERIGVARAGVKQGVIFTPETTALFRRLLHPETKDPDTKALLNEKKDQPKPGTVPLWKLGMPYPDKEPLATMPPEVLARLPKLPTDIEYRFVGKHLILRDSRANTIVDFAPNVIS